MKIRKEYTKVYRHQIENKLNNKDNAQEVLNIIYGDKFDDNNPNYLLFYTVNPYIKSTRTQRLNMLWAVPLTLIAAPFQYVVKGEVGWDDSSKLGRFIIKVTGH